MTTHYGCAVLAGKHVAVRLDDYARAPVPVGEPRKTPREAIEDVKELRRIEPVQLSWEAGE
jgi:hypothetical protein